MLSAKTVVLVVELYTCTSFVVYSPPPKVDIMFLYVQTTVNDPLDVPYYYYYSYYYTLWVFCVFGVLQLIILLFPFRLIPLHFPDTSNAKSVDM